MRYTEGKDVIVHVGPPKPKENYIAIRIQKGCVIYYKEFLVQKAVFDYVQYLESQVKEKPILKE